MTLTETRNLGIEFERRLQTMNEGFTIIKKLDTDTIYAYLNEAQRQVFTKVYNSVLSTKSEQEQIKYFSSMLGTFVQHKTMGTLDLVDVVDSDLPTVNTKVYKVPDNFFAYLRSTSVVTGGYNSVGTSNTNERRVQNIMLRHEDFSKYINEYFDGGIIIRRPIVLMNNNHGWKWEEGEKVSYDAGNTMTVIADNYTTINSTHLYYYRYPVDMSLFRNTACELPYALFEEIVETALQLYVAYSTGARQHAQPKQQEQAQPQEQTQQAEQ